MNNKSINSNFLAGVILLFMALITGFLINSCTSGKKYEKAKDTDQVVEAIADPEMKKVWQEAASQGQLPPVSEIPIPKERVTTRLPIAGEDTMMVKRPVIPKETIATAQFYSEVPFTDYDGMFLVTEHKPGVLIGTLQKTKKQIELHYKLPGERQKIDLRDSLELRLSYRDNVTDGALQRRIILITATMKTPFVFVSEGDKTPYKQTFDPLRLTIEQQQGEGNPPVTIRYADNSIILKQGERGTLGTGSDAVMVHLLESIAVDPALAKLSQGQPYYVSLILYRAE